MTVISWSGTAARVKSAVASPVTRTSRVARRKPTSETETAYVPDERPEMLYEPSADVAALRVARVAVFVAVTRAASSACALRVSHDAGDASVRLREGSGPGQDRGERDEGQTQTCQTHEVSPGTKAAGRSEPSAPLVRVGAVVVNA